jgi:hypothetical protein
MSRTILSLASNSRIPVLNPKRNEVSLALKPTALIPLRFEK